MRTRLPITTTLVNSKITKRPCLKSIARYHLVSLLVCIWIYSPASNAAQWIVHPEIEVGTDYNDNPLLVEDGTEESIFGGELNILAEFERRTELSEVVIGPRVELSRYSDDDDLDSTDLFLDLSAVRRSQTSTWSLDANISDQQVLRGEIESPEFDDTGVDDAQTGTGNILRNQDRTLLRINPEFSHTINQRATWILGASYLDIGYDPQLLGTAVDYDEGRIDTAFAYQLSSINKIRFSLFASEYETADSTNETTSYGATARFEQSISERSSFFAEVGYRDFDIETGINSPIVTQESSFLWNVGFSRRWQNSQFRMEAGQAVTPSGSGAMAERQRARATIDHHISPRLEVRIATIAQFTDTLASNSNMDDRDYFQGRLTLAYQLSRKWSMEAQVSFTDQDDKVEPGSAQATQAGLSVVYRPATPNR